MRPFHIYIFPFYLAKPQPNNCHIFTLLHFIWFECFLCLIPDHGPYSVSFYPSKSPRLLDLESCVWWLGFIILGLFSQTIFSERTMLQVTNDTDTRDPHLSGHQSCVFLGVLHSSQQNTSMLQSVNNDEGSQTHRWQLPWNKGRNLWLLINPSFHWCITPNFPHVS